MKTGSLSALLCVSFLLQLSIFSLTEGMKLKGLLRKRRQACTNGTYNPNPRISCCRCPAGQYVHEHCTTNGGDPKCEHCREDETFMNHPNGDDKCEICERCEDSANRMVLNKCTVYSNTVCGCKEGHYCDKGDACTACYKCNKCEDFGVKVPCSATSDTVCNKSPEPNVGATVAGAVVPIVILLILGAVLVWSWRMKKCCFEESPKSPDSEEGPILEDVDLTNFLPEIAKTLGLKKVKEVTGHGGMLTDVEIENIEHNYSRDAHEQTVQLLRAWHQKQGLNGTYGKLINTLTTLGYRRAAAQVKQVVIRGQEEN